jgi:hypothetical protein
MRRVLQDIFTTGLLILSAGVLVLWVRSHAVGDCYRWGGLIDLPNGGTMWQTAAIWTGDGGIIYTREEISTEYPETAQRIRWRVQRRSLYLPMGYTQLDDPYFPMRGGSSETLLGALGVYYADERRDTETVQRRAVTLTVPLWLLASLTAAYPLSRYVLGVLAREREERIVLGLCPRCGVDVRQCPARCPTCGKRHPLPLPRPAVA